VETPNVFGRRRKAPGTRGDGKLVGERRLDRICPRWRPRLLLEVREDVRSVGIDPTKRRDGTDDPVRTQDAGSPAPRLQDRGREKSDAVNATPSNELSTNGK